MSADVYKHYAESAQRGIRGEAYFESLVCTDCIPHQIDGLKDIGVDYICEWVYGDKPTGVLFIAQVKTTTAEKADPKFEKTATCFNDLDQYTLAAYSNLLKIEQRTLSYWKGLGLPAYLFVVVEVDNALDCYCKRFTGILTEPGAEYKYREGFFKVNCGTSFIAFKNQRKQGFARDLYIDHVRWSYYKGVIATLNPRDIGLQSFSPDALYTELSDTYKESILRAYEKTTQAVKFLKSANILPSDDKENVSVQEDVPDTMDSLIQAPPPLNDDS